MNTEKEMLLQEITSKINPENGFVVVEYKEFKANAVAEFRQQVVEAGGDFFALKKRIFAKAASDQGIDFDAAKLNGHIGLVTLNEDQLISTVKALYSFQKEHADNLSVLGGYFYSQKRSTQEVKQISELPTLQEMRSQFVGTISAPMSQVVGVINSILVSVPNCLDQYKSSKES